MSDRALQNCGHGRHLFSIVDTKMLSMSSAVFQILTTRMDCRAGHEYSKRRHDLANLRRRKAD